MWRKTRSDWIDGGGSRLFPAILIFSFITSLNHVIGLIRDRHHGLLPGFRAAKFKLPNQIFEDLGLPGQLFAGSRAFLCCS